jgi:hypothetical protein
MPRGPPAPSERERPPTPREELAQASAPASPPAADAATLRPTVVHTRHDARALFDGARGGGAGAGAGAAANAPAARRQQQRSPSGAATNASNARAPLPSSPLRPRDQRQQQQPPSNVAAAARGGEGGGGGGGGGGGSGWRRVKAAVSTMSFIDRVGKMAAHARPSTLRERSLSPAFSYASALVPTLTEDGTSIGSYGERFDRARRADANAMPEYWVRPVYAALVSSIPTRLDAFQLHF